MDRVRVVKGGRFTEMIIKTTSDQIEERDGFIVPVNVIM